MNDDLLEGNDTNFIVLIITNTLTPYSHEWFYFEVFNWLLLSILYEQLIIIVASQFDTLMIFAVRWSRRSNAVRPNSNAINANSYRSLRKLLTAICRRYLFRIDNRTSGHNGHDQIQDDMEQANLRWLVGYYQRHAGNGLISFFRRTCVASYESS